MKFNDLALISASTCLVAVQAASGGCTSAKMDLSSSSAVNSEFSLEAGAQSALAFGSDGMTVSITEAANNLALQSKTTFSPPLTLTVTMSGTNASGGVPCMAMWAGASGNGEAIDLELIGGSTGLAMLELYRNGVDSGYGTDIAVDASWMKQPSWNWVFNNVAGDFDSSQEHTWVMKWDTNYVSWSVDGDHIVNYTRTSAPFVDGPLPIRLGLWAVDPSNAWAGMPNWSATPTMTSSFKSVSVECGEPEFDAVSLPASGSASGATSASAATGSSNSGATGHSGSGASPTKSTAGSASASNSGAAAASSSASESSSATVVKAGSALVVIAAAALLAF